MDWIITCFDLSFRVMSFIVIFTLTAFAALFLIVLVIAIISALYKTFFEK